MLDMDMQEIDDFVFYLHIGAPILLPEPPAFRIISKISKDVPVIGIGQRYFTEEDYEILLNGQRIYKRIGDTLYFALSESQLRFVGNLLPVGFLYDLSSFFRSICFDHATAKKTLNELICRSSATQMSLEWELLDLLYLDSVPDDDSIHIPRVDYSTLPRVESCAGISYSLERDNDCNLEFTGEVLAATLTDSDMKLTTYATDDGYFVGSVVAYSPHGIALSSKAVILEDGNDIVRYFYNYGIDAIYLIYFTVEQIDFLFYGEDE